jgi:type II secretory pathway pseudopilin PulG
VSTNRCNAPGRDCRATQRRDTQAFTITELLVVISIIVLLIAIAVPALSGLMGSSERSLAENQLRAALAAARDAAIQSETGDAAAVFLFTLNPSGSGGHITIVPCVVAGQIEDIDDNNQGPSNTNQFRTRDVFVPIPTIEPIQLPRGWSVRAFAPPGTVFDNSTQMEQWYETYDTGGATAAQTRLKGHWLFPENAFYDPARPKEGTVRQSFIVRFKVGTGELDTSTGATALFFDPVYDTDATFRGQAPYNHYRADQLRIDTMIAPNAQTFVRRMLGDRPDFLTSNPAQMRNRRYLLGDSSLDTVMVRPVTELSLFQEQKMAASIGAGALNRNTGTLYGDAQGATPKRPTLDTSLFASGVTFDEINDRIDQWIEGRYHVNNQAGSPLVASDARLFTIEHYLGQMQELVP